MIIPTIFMAMLIILSLFFIYLALPFEKRKATDKQ
jgi:hypothetical protein